jgi:hypothetical protein
LVHSNFGLIVAFGVALTLCMSPAWAGTETPKPDLADLVEGEYTGDVISDARGSSQSDVHLTVTKTAHNVVSVTSDYRRMPTFTARLTRAMNTIQKVGGPEVFLVDLSKSPFGLDVTVDDASWSGARK